MQKGSDGTLHINKDLIGQDPAVLAQHAGLKVPAGTQLLFAETGAEHPFVHLEQMMPFVPFVRVSNVERAIALAKESEHGFGHTAVLHSRDTSVMSKMGKTMDCTIFVINGPSHGRAGLGRRGRAVVFDCRPDRRRRDHAADLLPPAPDQRHRRNAIRLNRNAECDQGPTLMQLGRVIGTATATVKHPTFQSERLLVVQLETPAGGPTVNRSWPLTGWGQAEATECCSPTTAVPSRVARRHDSRALERDGSSRPGFSNGAKAMRIAEVIGRVTLSRANPRLRGGRLLLALPMPLQALVESAPDRGEELVVYDVLGAGAGSLIGVSEGREAANPFGKTKTPVDAYCACLIDQLAF